MGACCAKGRTDPKLDKKGKPLPGKGAAAKKGAAAAKAAPAKKGAAGAAATNKPASTAAAGKKPAGIQKKGTINADVAKKAASSTPAKGTSPGKISVKPGTAMTKEKAEAKKQATITKASTSPTVVEPEK